MLKRKTHFALPVTQQDDAAMQSSYANGGARRVKTAGRLKRPSDLVGFVRFLTAILAIGLLVVGIQRLVVARKREGGGSYKAPSFPHYQPSGDDDTTANNKHRALQEFESLQYALDNSQLVALYFAASWCPMSKPVTLKIDQSLSDILLPPPSDPTQALPQRHGLSLVYVSSDRTGDEYSEYLENRPHWQSIPFDSPELAGIKRHFHTCAKPELEALHMERQHEIPTLIIVDGESHQVLTFGGVQDVMEMGASAVDEWFGLAKISQALEHKHARRAETDEEEESAEDAEEGHDSASGSGDEGV